MCGIETLRNFVIPRTIRLNSSACWVLTRFVLRSKSALRRTVASDLELFWWKRSYKKSILPSGHFSIMYSRLSFSVSLVREIFCNKNGPLPFTDRDLLLVSRMKRFVRKVTNLLSLNTRINEFNDDKLVTFKIYTNDV